MKKRYFVRGAEVPHYHPANHTGTRNHRLIGPETVGARGLEVVLGVIERGKGALPHAHPGIEQVCYVLEGTANMNIGGEEVVVPAGSIVKFPNAVLHDVRNLGTARCVIMFIKVNPKVLKGTSDG